MSSKTYDKYFSEGDYFDGLGKVMYDIRSSRISKQNLIELSDELINKGQMPADSQFEKKKWWSWSKQYVNYLMYGMSTGSISKEYLLFYARVSKAVKIRNMVLKIAIVVVAVIIVSLMINSWIKR